VLRLDGELSSADGASQAAGVTRLQWSLAPRGDTSRCEGVVTALAWQQVAVVSAMSFGSSRL